MKGENQLKKKSKLKKNQRQIKNDNVSDVESEPVSEGIDAEAIDLADDLQADAWEVDEPARVAVEQNEQDEVGQDEQDEDEFGEVETYLLSEDHSEEIDEETEEESEDESEETISATEGSELDAYESADIEDEEFLEHSEVLSIVESILFSTDRPQSLNTIRQAFKGTNIRSKDVRRAIEELQVEYAGACRGVTIEEVNGGYQLRTKADNMPYLKRMLKIRTFKLSGPALEVLSIVAYKQPCVKSDLDEIRGVESGHLLRGLMDRGMIAFAGKSELPGKPMLYQTTKRFLEIFGLRNLNELPSLSEIDELIPEGIGDEPDKEETLDQITEQMSQEIGSTYSEGEEELMKITDQLTSIETTSAFFDEEKRRQKEKRDRERAQDIQEAIDMGESVEDKDIRWLEKYQAELLLKQEESMVDQKEQEVTSSAAETKSDIASDDEFLPPTENEMEEALQALIRDQRDDENVEVIETTAADSEEETLEIDPEVTT